MSLEIALLSALIVMPVGTLDAGSESRECRT